MSTLWNKIKRTKDGSPKSHPHSSRAFRKSRWASEVVFAQHHLDFCLSRHVQCPRLSSEGFLPTRVIDVGSPDGSEDPRLVDKASLSNDLNQASKRRYIALSYCWGLQKNITTTSENLASMQTCIPWAQLPQTITDAIEVTRALQIRYIWVDALCIIQDSAEDWKSESVRMADVYGGAYLTISAALGPDVYHGLSRRANGTSNQVPLRLEPLYKRAWTLQERILSPRVLIFGTHDTYWECRMEQIGQSGERIPEALCFRLLPKPLHQDWHVIVKDYTCRLLTKETDKLPAIDGLAAAYGEATGKAYLAGLWKESLLEDLLWEQGSWEDGNWVKPSVPAQYRAPSWSWASLDGNVSKPSTHKMNLCARVLGTFLDGWSLDSFGEDDKWIFVKGACVRKLYELGRIDFGGIQVYAQMDYRARVGDEWKQPETLPQVWCLLIGTAGSGRQKTGYGLVLARTETGATVRNSNIYTRVGKFYLDPTIMYSAKDMWNSCEETTMYII